MKNIAKNKKMTFEEMIVLKELHTISKKISDGKDHTLILFSLSRGSDISGEFYDEGKIYFLLEGKLKFNDIFIGKGDCIAFSPKTLFNIFAIEDSFLIEVTISGKEYKMENLIKGEIINLKDSISYVDGAISNIDIVSKENLKIMVMAFDKGEGLSPHSAPGDALVIPLEGEAILSVGDKSYEIKVGEQLVFPKNIEHSVKAKTKYKMLLILSID